MGKYSSDSDSDKRSSRKYKHSSSRRSSSPDSGDRYRRRKDKKSDRHRSRSRDRYSKSRRSRSTSSHRSYKSRRRRSDSHDRSRHRSRDRYRRSRSRDKYRSRKSRSRSYIKEYTSKPKRRTPSSDSSLSDSSRSSSKTIPKAKEKTISTQNTILIRDDDEPIVMDSKVLEEINGEGFAQKQFSSANKKVPDNIVIDLKKQTIKVPAVEPTEPDTIYHHNLFLNEEARIEKWVKELFSFRHKALLK